MQRQRQLRNAGWARGARRAAPLGRNFLFSFFFLLGEKPARGRKNQPETNQAESISRVYRAREKPTACEEAWSLGG